jgi:hypothetical protein
VIEKLLIDRINDITEDTMFHLSPNSRIGDYFTITRNPGVMLTLCTLSQDIIYKIDTNEVWPNTITLICTIDGKEFNLIEGGLNE